ncbi:hypothetical protein [endosymbiont of Lamellibrachia barhami]|uniref:hypothetical protein n=1 Tax=endosymbiont of Lamellibrachia barhami TaxID=205975 RepID=UPI0015BC9BF5|nr:hypothetical protein [endosymbiont of Lamellibrachia barhami]
MRYLLFLAFGTFASLSLARSDSNHLLKQAITKHFLIVAISQCADNSAYGQISPSQAGWIQAASPTHPGLSPPSSFGIYRFRLF